MKKIFINYSWEHDAPTAEHLYNTFSANSELAPWMDKKDLAGGLQWRPAIRKAIREADFFISLLSCDSIKGRGERNKEIYEALDVLKEFPPGDIYLIPVRINECVPPFEGMSSLQWVDLFPDWNDGFASLMESLGVNGPVKNMPNEDGPMAATLKYHYRIGIVDLDMGLVNLREIAEQLNAVQRYFLFTLPEMPRLKRCTETIDKSKNFAVYRVPKAYIEEHRHLSVDLLACITKYPLAFEENDKILSDYFAGPSDLDERFLFLSADSLYRYCKEANCALEEGIVYLLCGQLIGYFTELDYHPLTKGCVMDFCDNRDDLIRGLKDRKLCKVCLKGLPAGELKTAILKLLDWKYS
jgi:hypothetical protein